MFELVIYIKDKNTNQERRIERSFSNAGAMAAFYNSQPGKSIEREIDNLYKSPSMKK
jgi:hypothetical protein